MSQLDGWAAVGVHGMLDSVKLSCDMNLQECSASKCCDAMSE